MKISAIIADAASLCGDDDKSRKGLAWYEARVNDFFAATAPEHQETLLNASGTLDPVPAGLTGDDDFPWDDCYDCACRYYVTWQFYAADSEDTRDAQKAKEYLRQYEDVFAPKG